MNVIKFVSVKTKSSEGNEDEFDYAPLENERAKGNGFDLTLGLV